MSAVPKPQQGQRSWTDAQRAEQARKLRQRQIWLKSTGPKTIEGKLNSSRNACSSHYEERQEMKLICRYLRTQNHYTRLLRFVLKQGHKHPPYAQNLMELHLNFFENELIDIERKMFGGMRFSEIIGSDSRKIIPFPTAPP